ncbi:MAG: glycosyltransferase family 4 protein, partial [Bacteroidales bacterium]|nr:glycosyltransferase family 4 protein [Bacteroidales bacterium]
MRILWFTGTPSLYEQKTHPYNGVGWIYSLETLLRQQSGIELAISFLHESDNGRAEKEGVIYYPIKRTSITSNPMRWIINNHLGIEENEAYYLKKLLDIVNDFNPDIIHIFGTEGIFALLQGKTPKPIIIQLQGILNPCKNAFFPPIKFKSSFNSINFIKEHLLGTTLSNRYKLFCNMAEREKICFSRSKCLVGHTEWDKNVSLLMAPQAKYFHIDEVLRPIFYLTKKENYRKGKTIKIVSTLSPTIYKGIDVVFKTADLLKKSISINFVWDIIGIDGNSQFLKKFEKELKISHVENNLVCLGKKSPEEIATLLLDADLFVHPSYIDNSPNSVCEAQILGLPVIACNVGGLATLIDNGSTGLLIPSNGVFELAHIIADYDKNPEVYFNYGRLAREKALQRHNKTIIINDLLNLYNQ